MTEEEICHYLGVDKLLYQTQEDLVEAVTRRGAHHMSRPCMACMDGFYICGDITEEKIKILEKKRISESGTVIATKELS